MRENILEYLEMPHEVFVDDLLLFANQILEKYPEKPTVDSEEATLELAILERAMNDKGQLAKLWNKWDLTAGCEICLADVMYAIKDYLNSETDCFDHDNLVRIVQTYKEFNVYDDDGTFKRTILNNTKSTVGDTKFKKAVLNAHNNLTSIARVKLEEEHQKLSVKHKQAGVPLTFSVIDLKIDNDN